MAAWLDIAICARLGSQHPPVLRASERWIEQPVAESNGAVTCPICGHPVDPKRMQPHMLRFHGGVTR